MGGRSADRAQLHYGVADDKPDVGSHGPFGVRTASGEAIETVIRQYPESPLLQRSLDVEQKVYGSSRSAFFAWPAEAAAITAVSDE